MSGLEKRVVLLLFTEKPLLSTLPVVVLRHAVGLSDDAPIPPVKVNARNEIAQRVKKFNLQLGRG